MYNQIEMILEQYDMEIQEVTKARGAFVCETKQGRFMLVPFRGTREKGRCLGEFLRALQENGFVVEQLVYTKSNEAVAEDEYTGERFLCKTYVDGTEMNVAKPRERLEAVRMLAIYHNISSQLELPAEGREESSPMETWQRHGRELTKAYNYMRGRKKKTEFEQLYLQQYAYYQNLAQEGLSLLEKPGTKAGDVIYCHGDFNQHNVRICDGMYRIVNFENTHRNWPMTDLSNFVRKMLEKNDWDEAVGIDMLVEYDRYRRISKGEYQQLCGLMLFPEKFWKVTNHYMSARKTWISSKEVEKLKKVIVQEEKRRAFMEKLVAFLK